jgi:hypothetical protein
MSFAKIQVTVEVQCDGSYGNDWKLKDMFEQTAREGKNKLERAIREIGGKIIGEVHVIMVIVPEDKK